MSRLPLAALACAALILPGAAGTAFGQQPEKPLLLQRPALSRTLICFTYAGDLWTVPREGGDARRLTSGPGIETGAQFSPDGSLIAFTGEYDGNIDLFVVPAAGGTPRRLTYHPGVDSLQGWTPDGKSVLFRSNRASHGPFSRLFTQPVDGVSATELPLPTGNEGSFSPDGSRIAYVPVARAFQAWKRYRGGRTTPIWLANLADSSIERVPRDNSNDFQPMWIGDRIYFLSDRNGPVTLFSYDPTAKKVTQLIKNDGLDIKSATAGPGAIVYDQFGTLHLFDLQSLKSKPVPIRLEADLPELRPRWVKVARQIESGNLSPTGVRGVFEARGDIFTVPVEKGDVRNLTQTPGVAERDPAWSPDGKWIAYFSDESGEYALHVREQSGQGETRKFALGTPGTFYYSPVWSPDSKKVAYTDKRLNVWVLDLEKGTPVKVDTEPFEGPSQLRVPTWSPDSRWIAYSRLLKNRLHAVFLYNLETTQSQQVTDGMSDALFPTWDKSGKYLYFAASTDVGLRVGGGDMSGFGRPITRSLYAVVLRNDLPSPLAPESDEEKVAEDRPTAAPGGAPMPGTTPTPGTPAAPGAAGAGAKPAGPEPVRIDLERIGQRIVALPLPARNYAGIGAPKPGILLTVEAPLPGSPAPGATLIRYDLNTRKLDRLLDGISGLEVSANGDKLLLLQPGGRWAVAPTATPAAARPLNTDAMEAYVDPRAEWRQMFREAWRLERDFFYDPSFHGLDLQAAERRYAPYLESIASRGDLNYLFDEMLGELSVGHLYVSGGDTPEVKQVPGGLLGADYTVDNGRYRISRVYDGESWNPQLRAPLTQPGVNVAAGEFLLAVNGRELRATDDLNAFFEGTAGKQTRIRVGPDTSGTGSREVTVIPVASETSLRNLAWVEGNRRKVAERSNNRLAYVYIPDTGMSGYVSFNRYYFSQVDKEGAIIDERFNGGGALADYFVDYMRRSVLNYTAGREGGISPTPIAAIYGPKAMLINENAGSGGDALPWYFRKLGIGPLIGKRTWGGLVGIGGYPKLIDGGEVTAPRTVVYDTTGESNVENRGIAPDIEVELDPAAWRQGRDLQLEKAIDVVMEALRKSPPQQPVPPKYPRYHKATGS